MNNKNVYSLNNTFEGKIWVDWKGKDGKMGQEISWREKPNISTLRKSPRIGTCVRVRGILNVNVNGTGTRVHSCKRLRPCAVSPNLWLRPAANNTHVYGNGCIQWYVNTSLRFWGHCLCRLKTSDRIGHRPMFQKNIGHRIGRQNWHRLILS